MARLEVWEERVETEELADQAGLEMAALVKLEQLAELEVLAVP